MDEFIGQRQTVERLLFALECARRENRPLEPVMISGPSGTGKTTMSRLIAAKQRSQPTLYRASATYTARQLQSDLENLAAGPSNRPLLVLDELHALPKKTRDALLVVMDQLTGQLPGSPAASARATICGLTNGTVIAPLRRRFPNQFRFTPFSEDELVQVIQLFARKANVDCDPGAAKLLGHVSFTPGRARGLFTEARNRAVALSRPLDNALAHDVLTALDIDPESGLDDQHRTVLVYLCKSGQASQESIRAALGIEDESAYCEVEQLLVHLGYIVVTSRGRKPTKAARDLVKQQAE